MHKKRIKVLLSKLTLEILKRDSKHFKISKEKLCNDVLINFSLKRLLGVERELFDEKAYLQFSLTQANSEYYNIISKNIEDEPTFIKNMFTSYIHLNPFYRETYIFKDKLIIVSSYIEKKEEINVSIKGALDRILIEGVIKCNTTDYIKLKTNKGCFYLSDIRLIL